MKDPTFMAYRVYFCKVLHNDKYSKQTERKKIPVGDSGLLPPRQSENLYVSLHIAAHASLVLYKEPPDRVVAIPT